MSERAYLVKLPANIADVVDKMAEEEGNPKAAVLRRLISKGLKAEAASEGSQQIK